MGANIFQIAGLYFEYTNQLVGSSIEPRVQSGVERVSFHGIVTRKSAGEPFVGLMTDRLGDAKIHDFFDNGEEGWGYAKVYEGPSAPHTHRISYEFYQRDTSGAYWIGKYLFNDNKFWGETHAVLTPLSTIFMNLSRLPQVPLLFGVDGVLPRLEGQPEYLLQACQKLATEERPIIEVWVEVCCMCKGIANCMSCSMEDVFEDFRKLLEKSWDPVDALRFLRSKANDE